jgi:hypothetical protein
MEISISRNLIGGKTTNAYENRFKNQLSIGDKLVLIITGERKIRGFGKITGDYKYDTTPVWPIIRGETYPHRRSIVIEKLFNESEAPASRKKHKLT